MNKLMKILAASALVATTLVGCSGSKANYAKVGLGVVSNYNEGQVNTTFVAIGLDSDGKIQYIDLDVAQSTPGDAKAQYDKTKEERGAEYAMKESSPIKKEWNEQAEAFENYCIGKTPDEVAKTETMDYHGGKAAKEGTDLAAGCTITIDDFLAAVEKANKNAVEVEADSVVLGRTMSNDAEAKEVDTTLALLALDADKKVAYAKIDVAQITEKITDTKSERGAGYGMKESSPIKKEWNEQAAAFEEYCKGKTVEEIAKVETMDFHGGKAAKEGTDLAAGCTITLDAFLEAISKAK